MSNGGADKKKNTKTTKSESTKAKAKSKAKRIISVDEYEENIPLSKLAKKFQTKKYENGDMYKGKLKNGKPEGHGVMTYTNGDEYDGKWKAGKKEGHGIFTYADGDKYDGKWKDNKKHGHGVSTSADGSKYDGSWKSGEKEGKGVMTHKNGTKYDGFWKDSFLEGHGVLTFGEGQSKGDVYNGKFKKNKKHGHGVYTWANGSKYNGDWKNDIREGYGTQTYADGRKEKGEWKNDKLVKKIYGKNQTIQKANELLQDHDYIYDEARDKGFLDSIYFEFIQNPVNLQIIENSTGIRKIDTKNIFQQQTIDKILKTPKREHPFTRQRIIKYHENPNEKKKILEFIKKKNLELEQEKIPLSKLATKTKKTKKTQPKTKKK